MSGLSREEITPLFPRGPSPNVKIVLILVASIGLMVLDHTQKTLDPVRSGIAVALQPIQMAAELPSDLGDVLYGFINRDEVIAQNKALKREVLLLKSQLQKVAALEAENERIRALLQSARSLEEDVLIAEILAVSPDPYRHRIKLNKGNMDGVFEGQALVDANGIMGQVVQVNMMNATAILITDANHGIPVEFNRTGLQTIAQGTGKSSKLLLPFLPSNADVREGDLLVSSGLGGRYPAGYPVARVTGVSHKPGDEFLTVNASPTASLHRGREVLLVWTEQPPPEQAGSEQPSSEQAGLKQATPEQATDEPTEQ